MMEIEMIELGQCCEVIPGQSPPSSTYNQDGDGMPFFQGKADFGELFPTVRYWCNKPKKISQPNDILFSLRAPVGPTNINNVTSCIGRGLAAIRCKDVDLMYLLHFLRGNEKKIASLGTGSTFKAIKIGVLKELKIPLPPLPTQKKIAALLDAADLYRQKTKALIEKYDELTQSLFLDMFGDPVVNEKGWEKVKLSLITNMKAGKFVRASDINSENGEGLFPCYGGNGLRGFVKTYTHDGDFVLIGRQGALCGNVKLAFGKFHATEHAIVCSPKRNFNTEWLYFLLDILDLNKLATGAAQPGLNVSTLNKFEVVFAPLYLQNQFAERIQKIEAQKAQAQESLEKAEELFNSLLGRAFNGELSI